MDRKDLPRIAIRIGKPKFVLSRKAAGEILFNLFENALFL